MIGFCSKSFNSKTVADRVAARLDLTLLSAVAAAEDAAAFLDERLHKSTLRDGFLALFGNSSIPRTSSSMTPRWTCARPPMNSPAPTRRRPGAPHRRPRLSAQRSVVRLKYQGKKATHHLWPNMKKSLHFHGLKFLVIKTDSVALGLQFEALRQKSRASFD